MPTEISEPWKSFLSEIYGLPRTTADVDVVAIATASSSAHLIGLAGKGSELHRRHGVYLDLVGVAPLPEDYESRLTEVFPGAFKKIRLLALDPYNIDLSKPERNTQRDRDDVKYLVRLLPIDLTLLEQRYEEELKPILGNPDRESLTLRLWIEAIEEERLS